MKNARVMSEHVFSLNCDKIAYTKQKKISFRLMLLQILVGIASRNGGNIRRNMILSTEIISGSVQPR